MSGRYAGRNRQPSGERSADQGVRSVVAISLHSISVALAIALSIASDAAAHSGGIPKGPDRGIRIAAITHGQMQVLARYSGTILDLAGRQRGTDESFRRVLNYAHVQKTYCAHGLMPGSISDETSPFNQCSHAYLAATRDVLRRMGALPSRSPSVDDLLHRIDVEMLENGAALALCQYSGEFFNTALTLEPDWSTVLFHPPSLVAIASPALLGLALALVRLRRRSQPANMP